MFSSLIRTLIRTHTNFAAPAPPNNPKTPLFQNNLQAARNALMQSLFHTQGPHTFKKEKGVDKSMEIWLKDIEKLQQELIEKREKRLGLGQKAYVESYVKLGEGVKKGNLNNEWLYRIVGWYNLTAFYPNLLDKLLLSSGKELILLIETLSWMKYNWGTPYGYIGPKGKAADFYRTLTLDLIPSQLQQLQTILIIPIFYSKRTYYSNYLNRHLDTLLNPQQLADLVWLYQMWIHSMNDDQTVASRVEQYLITTGGNLDDNQKEKLMQAYALKGGISKPFYNHFLRPYLLKRKMANIEGLAEALRFLICSEADDNLLLKNIYEQISIQHRSDRPTTSKSLYTLHLYTHYLRTKGYRITLPAKLEDLLNNFCKQRSQGRSYVSRFIHNQLSQPNQTAQTKTKYHSECLNTGGPLLGDYDRTKNSYFENRFKYKLASLDLKNMRIYEKEMFCCFELDFCLVGDPHEQPIDIQLEGMQYVFTSGRRIRERQIRDEMLTHYGFKIRHIDYKTYRESENELTDQYLINAQPKTNQSE